jgi:hypothetical protein
VGGNSQIFVRNLAIRFAVSGASTIVPAPTRAGRSERGTSGWLTSEALAIHLGIDCGISLPNSNSLASVT